GMSTIAAAAPSASRTFAVNPVTTRLVMACTSGAVSRRLARASAEAVESAESVMRDIPPLVRTSSGSTGVISAAGRHPVSRGLRSDVYQTSPNVPKRRSSHLPRRKLREPHRYRFVINWLPDSGIRMLTRIAGVRDPFPASRLEIDGFGGDSGRTWPFPRDRPDSRARVVPGVHQVEPMRPRITHSERCPCAAPDQIGSLPLMNQYETATKSMLLKPHRERAERRGKRATIITGSVVAALIVGGLVATGTAAMAEEAAGSRETGSVQLATGRVADQAQAAVDAAESVMER